MFGLQLECLKIYREQNQVQHLFASSVSPIEENRIRRRFNAFNSLSTSGQRLRVISVGQDMQQTFEKSKSSALNINEDLKQASLIKTIFEANDTRYELSFDKKKFKCRRNSHCQSNG
jgi:hypothetical protein